MLKLKNDIANAANFEDWRTAKSQHFATLTQDVLNAIDCCKF